MDTPGDAAGYRMRGVRRELDGDLEGALADLDEAIRLDPDNLETYILRSSVRQGLGDMIGFTDDLARASRIDLERARRLAPPGIELGEMPNVIQVNIDPAAAPQGE